MVVGVAILVVVVVVGGGGVNLMGKCSLLVLDDRLF